jgi:hypothetical protein
MKLALAQQLRYARVEEAQAITLADARGGAFGALAA